MEKAVQTLCAAAVIAAALNSCSTASHSTGNSYQKHLSHKHTGGHYLSTNNKGCNWNR